LLPVGVGASRFQGSQRLRGLFPRSVGLAETAFLSPEFVAGGLDRAGGVGAPVVLFVVGSGQEVGGVVELERWGFVAGGGTKDGSGWREDLSWVEAALAVELTGGVLGEEARTLLARQERSTADLFVRLVDQLGQTLVWLGLLLLQGSLVLSAQDFLDLLALFFFQNRYLLRVVVLSYSRFISVELIFSFLFRTLSARRKRVLTRFVEE